MPEISSGLSVEVGEAAPQAGRRGLLAYAGLIMLLAMMAAPYGGLMSIPLLFFLKNRLHLAAHQLALFNFWTSIPLYAAFLFGLLRDRWNPFGMGDRGHLVLFGALTAATYAFLAAVSPSHGLLLLGIFAVTAGIQVPFGAANGIFSSLGHRHLMPGQASAVLNISTVVPSLVGFILGGAFSQWLEGQEPRAAAKAVFLLGAGLTAAMALAGAAAPRALYVDHAEPREGSLLGDIGRLLKTPAVWPPLILLLLWNFAPSFGAALQYHLSNTLHATDAQVGDFYAIFWGLYVPCFLVYGWLCRRVRLSWLLFWSTLIAVPQMLPLLLVHTAQGALIAAVPMSLMGGFASAAYIDLAIRSCPKGLQGAMMMLVGGTAYYVALRLGDLFGTEIYDRHGGFVMTVVASTAVYALMLPVLLLAPRRLTSTTDGQALAVEL
jgi:MFS family permease